MAKKYDIVTEIYEKISKEVISSPEKWGAFLRSAGYNFRLRFDEQLLVFAQRPDATAVLPIERWNESFGRWVNRGAHGIAVFEDANRVKQRLAHYFDVSDTHESRYSRSVPIWTMQDEHTEDVINTLESTFGELENKSSLPNAIICAAENAVEDNLPDYTNDLIGSVDGSFLDGLSEEEVDIIYKKAVTNSVAYMIMARLGIDASEILDTDDLRDVVNFTTPDTLNAIGFATSDIAEMGLAEVSKTILSIERQNRTIAENKDSDYNVVENTNERSFDDGRTDLYNAGRLQPAQPNTSRTDRGNTGTLRTDAPEVPEGEPQGSVLQSSDEMQVDRTPLGSGKEGDRDGRSTSETDGREGRFDRESESFGYDGLGSEDEQYEEQGSGNRESRGDLQLNELPPFTDEKLILGILLNPKDDLVHRKELIVQRFKEYNDIWKTQYVKTIYNGKFNRLDINGTIVGYKQEQNGLHIWEGDFRTRTKESVFSWSIVSQSINNLIEKNEYIKIGNNAINAPLEYYDRNNEDKSLPFFGPDDTIRETFATTPHLNASKSEIRAFYETHRDNDERTEYIKSIFNNDYTEVLIGENHERRVGYKTMQNVLHLWEGSYLSRTAQSFYDWGTIAQHFEAMRLLGELQDTMKPLPSIDGQVTFMSTLVEEKTSAFSFSQEIIDAVLTRGSGVSEGKMRIYDQFQKNLSAKENADFLKDEYGWGGSYPVIVGAGIDENHDGKGIAISKGFGSEKPHINLSWIQVQNRVAELIRLDRYLNPKEKEHYPAWLEKQEQRRVDMAERNTNREILHNAPPEKETVREVPTRYEYHLGDTVYIGADEFEILNLGDDTVTLFDTQYPLFNKEFSCAEFEQRVQENPMNDHLKVSNTESVIRLELEARENIKTDDDLVSIDEYELAEKRNKTEPVKPAWENKPKRKTQSFDLHPEIFMADRHTFDLTNNEVETVSKKQRFRRNIVAVQLLKKCQEEKRFATPDEQLILSKYVGWGGIPEAFDESSSSWATEYLELSVVLTPDEYSRARESTLTAFYTPPEVVAAIYKAMEQMGFREGNILEPSCGIGNFMGMLPKEMQESKFYGVELDPISAGIAQQLYQKTSIAAQGFEKASLPDSFFDAVVGNVPFGDFKVADKRYDKNNFLIHDYFFAKSLDKLRPGGIMVLITSKGTLDKENSNVRKYIAQRADLLGAIRLPNNTFKGNAGTEVVSDILILQKRDRIVDIKPDWVQLDTNEDGIKMNNYFVKHPEMILGEMKMVSGRFGMEATCEPYENADLESQLADAIANVHGEITEYEVEDELEEEDKSIPADPTVRNFSYTLVDGEVYFRENSRMTPVEVSATAGNRIKSLIGIRDCVRNLMELQTDDFPDEEIKTEQNSLNSLYDSFSKKYGLINSRANSSAFSQDSSYSLLSALEIVGDDGELERKADMFFKRTIKPHTPVTSVDTSSEALAVSMGEKAQIDMEYMCQLTGKTEEEIFADLKGVIFLNPLYEYGSSNFQKYLMADEYLSGNVREKLAIARSSAKLYPEDYTVNMEALEKVQPKDLTASEIAVRLGATWVPPEIIQEFIFDFLDTPRYAQWNIKVHFPPVTSEWNIEGKAYDRSNVKAYSTYGTSRINAYKIIEETLNLKDVRIFDYVEDEEGKKKAVLNKQETAIAQSKQELIKQGFQDWIWADLERREKLTTLYNEKFNSNRPREYDGSHITFKGMNPEIDLREHQRNAVAHILYGGNTLLAHCVGAGKTFEMTAAAMESKRLGLCNKSLFVVPNHLTEQWASEFLQLYPAANVLVATKKDFETKNRKRFCGRIATGDYDAVIIGHSQFEKIPMSIERQRAILEQQLEEITNGIANLKHNRGENFSVKQLEKSRKAVKLKLDKLNDQSRKDDVVTFEELGCDRLFIDESHYYKNLFLYTKMRNVGGIAQTEAQKSSDLFMKCRYLDELTGGRGTVFATGTPISNSMVELYTIQRYLQYNTLQKNNLQHFDGWASTFGETVTAVELTPEGTGYRAKTRFAKFYNLPELMTIFKEVADIQTADMLNLPVPKVNFHTISLEPSEIQKEMVTSLAERAEAIRNGSVDPSVDNMLKITNDGRKLALDQRLINGMLPDFEGSKVNACIDNIFTTWEKTKEKKSAQLAFCDLSTPKNDGSFSIYTDIRKKLIARGVPEEEIQFIHDADTEQKKQELFKKVRRGDVRILLGSTAKMGSGTNVQNKLIASSDIDCPWRPSDLEQRLGRTVRQGNENAEVDAYRYVVKGTFDAYLYQLIEGKQKFASQIMTSKSPVRSCEDIDETALSYAEIKMLATGNPYIKEKMDLDIQVQKLKLLKSNYLSEKYGLEDKIIKYYPQQIIWQKERIENLKFDVIRLEQHPKPTDDRFVGMVVMGVSYSEKQQAGQAIINACKTMTSPDPIPLGEYRDFDLELLFNSMERTYEVKIKGNTTQIVALGDDVFGNITRIDNRIERIPELLDTAKAELDNTERQFETAKKEVEKPFPQEEDLKAKTVRLDELNILLNLDKKENELVDGEPDEGENEIAPKSKDKER